MEPRPRACCCCGSFQPAQDRAHAGWSCTVRQLSLEDLQHTMRLLSALSRAGKPMPETILAALPVDAKQSTTRDRINCLGGDSSTNQRRQPANPSGCHVHSVGSVGRHLHMLGLKYHSACQGQGLHEMMCPPAGCCADSFVSYIVVQVCMASQPSLLLLLAQFVWVIHLRAHVLLS